MKAIFFGATLHVAAAINLIYIANPYHAHNFAQIAAHQASNSLTEGESFIATDATTITDAHCEEVQNEILVRTNTPECQLVKKPNSDAMLIHSVDQIGKQARDIHAALEAEFAKPAYVVNTAPSTFTVNGCSVKIGEPITAPAAPATTAETASKSEDANDDSDPLAAAVNEAVNEAVDETVTDLVSEAEAQQRASV